MKPAFEMLVLTGDGSRVVRLRLPRWLVYGTGASLLALVTVTIGVSSRYALLERRGTEMAALEQRVSYQRNLIDAFHTRVTAVRSELAGWKQAHARMWAALGPDAPPPPADSTGVGGARDDATPELVGPRPLVELDQLASSVAAESPRVHELSDMVSRIGKIMSALPLRWPIHGRVNSEFGPRKSPWSGRTERHPGLDIGAPLGTPVKAPAAGTVVVASAWGDYGKHVKIDHGHGVRTLHGHMSEIDVKVGQHVDKNQVIGRVGSTGRSTGPHLHYEVQVAGKKVDPRQFLWER